MDVQSLRGVYPAIVTPFPHRETFRMMTRLLRQAANALCGGRLCFVMKAAIPRFAAWPTKICSLIRPTSLRRRLG